MGTASTDNTFWAFVWYLMNNPHKRQWTRQDIHWLAEKFAETNSTEITSATDPGGTYTDIEWPDEIGAGTVTAVGNSSTFTEQSVSKLNWALVDEVSRLTLDQAFWPNTHVGG